MIIFNRILYSNNNPYIFILKETQDQLNCINLVPLKKIATILLLGILVFNLAGYQLFSAYIESKKNAELENQLDNNNYDDSQLISVKIPVTYLPYYNNSISYERIDGQIEIEGVQYKYVKRRIYHDSLEMLCIPDHNSMKLLSAKNEFFKFVNDLQHPGQNKNTSSGSAKSLATDYENAFEQFKIDKFHFKIPFASQIIARISSAHRELLERPPKSC
jgi:hypothetical protein